MRQPLNSSISRPPKHRPPKHGPTEPKHRPPRHKNRNRCMRSRGGETEAESTTRTRGWVWRWRWVWVWGWGRGISGETVRIRRGAAPPMTCPLLLGLGMRRKMPRPQYSGFGRPDRDVRSRHAGLALTSVCTSVCTNVGTSLRPGAPGTAGAAALALEALRRHLE